MTNDENNNCNPLYIDKKSLRKNFDLFQSEWKLPSHLSQCAKPEKPYQPTLNEERGGAVFTIFFT